MSNIDEAFLEEMVFPIISFAGESKSLAYEALRFAKNEDFENAEKKMKESEDLILKAHEMQTALITKEADGEDIKVSMIFVHAQDHLMCAMSERTLIKEMIDILKIIYKK